MKVWIDQDLCTGDGLCEEIAPDVFTLLDDGLAYVKEGDKIYATAKGNPQGAEGLANIPDGQLDAVIESAEECPGECIFIEPVVRRERCSSDRRVDASARASRIVALPEEPRDGQEAGVGDHAVVGAHGLAVDVPAAVEHLERAGVDPLALRAPRGPAPPG